MSHSTRRSLIFACAMVLIVIGGTMAYFVTNGFGVPSIAAPEAPVTFTNSNTAPLAAGDAPSVTIDDPDTHVFITASSDGKIHVDDVNDQHGWMSGSRPRVSVAQSGSMVKISRAHSSGFHLMIGSFDSQLNVAVPAHARLTITDADGLDINGVDGDVVAHAGDGTMRITATNGALDLKAGGGRIYLTNVHAPRIVAHSYSGRLVFNDVTTEQLDGDTRDGRILADGLKMIGDAPRAVLSTSDGPVTVTATFPANGTYTLRTADGDVRLRVPPTSSLNVVAAAKDGDVTADSGFTTSGEDGHKTAKIGGAAASVNVSSESGSIHLETTGAL